MQVQETERTSQYRFWFDVREPGAAAYAGQIGAMAVYYLLIFSTSSVVEWFGYAGLVPSILVLMWFMGAVRRLNLWACLVVTAAIAWKFVKFVLPSFSGEAYYVSSLLSGFLLMVVLASGLPIATWAAWVHRRLKREERWDLVQLQPAAAELSWFKRRGLELVGLARPQPLFIGRRPSK